VEFFGRQYASGDDLCHFHTYPQNIDETLLGRCIHNSKKLVLTIGYLQKLGVCCYSHTILIYYENTFDIYR
jgi:hypothetical protein